MIGVYLNGTLLTKFNDEEDTIESLTDYLSVLDDDELEQIRIKPLIKKDLKVEEKFVEDVSNQSWTIWSSSDLAKDEEQIPLVKIITNADGELEAQAVGNSPFDLESLKTAQNSLKSSIGKPIKDRILRIDKSLNHNDPFFSTELQRQNMAANKSLPKKSIKDILGDIDPKTLSDEPETGSSLGIDASNLDTLSKQILITNRDDLKAIANKKLASEEELVDMFEEITGVNYYTEKITDEEQYEYLLDLMGRSHDIYDEDYVDPQENAYVMSLKDLTEDLIEKVLLKQDPDFYKKK